MPDNPPSRDFGPSTQQLDAALTRDALPAGTRLGGYQIIEVLGRGGFGIVYLALDSSLQRQVAIKEYFPAELAMRCDDHQVWVKAGVDVNAYAVGKAAFLNEAKMLARFDHPALARVHSFWEENRSAYMVMPYYEGRSLAATLAALPRPPDEAWLRALLAPLLSALSTLHSAQCLHLDISPENIILLPDGQPVLIDFGVANRLATDKTLPLTALLNPAYAPIEQYNASAAMPLGAWTDLYALAGVLHFAITGQPPARATVRAVDDPQRPLAETVHTLSQRFPGLYYSSSFLAGIDTALAVRPRDRPHDVAEFQLSLDHTLSGPAPTAAAAHGRRSEPVFEHATQRDGGFAADPSARVGGPPGRRKSAWIAGLGVLALAAAGAWAWLQMQPFPTIVFTQPTATSAAPEAAMPASAVPAPPAATDPWPVAAAASLAAASGPASATPPTPPAMVSAPLSVEQAAPAAAATAPPATEAEPPTQRTRRATQATAAQEVRQQARQEAEEASTPRAACGTRANFSLVYCLQTQCNRPKFARHPQCIDLRRRGEID